MARHRHHIGRLVAGVGVRLRAVWCVPGTHRPQPVQRLQANAQLRHQPRFVPRRDPASRAVDVVGDCRRNRVQDGPVQHRGRGTDSTRGTAHGGNRRPSQPPGRPPRDLLHGAGDGGRRHVGRRRRTAQGETRRQRGDLHDHAQLHRHRARQLDVRHLLRDRCRHLEREDQGASTHSLVSRTRQEQAHRVHRHRPHRDRVVLGRGLEVEVRISPTRFRGKPWRGQSRWRQPGQDDHDGHAALGSDCRSRGHARTAGH